MAGVHQLESAKRLGDVGRRGERESGIETQIRLNTIFITTEKILPDVCARRAEKKEKGKKKEIQLLT